jgi:hypothetical protein
MGDPIQISIPQMPKFLKAILDTPNQELKAMRGEMGRGLKRMRKRFIRTQLQGPPGIKAGKLTRGKNIFTYVNASSFASFGGKIGISRILHVHEVGLTIKPKSTGKLYLHVKGKHSPIFAVVSKVVIPARLKFRQLVAAESPGLLKAVGQSAAVATEKTLQHGLLRS